jgi:hypothetical protein
VVSSPSTPGSYIYNKLEDFAKYDEKTVQSSQPNMQKNPKDARQEDLMNRLNFFLNPQNKRAQF